MASQRRDGSSELLEVGRRVVLLGNIDEGNGSSSGKRKVLRRRQPLLSDGDIVVVLSPNEE
jgi:hypothetical protein